MNFYIYYFLVLLNTHGTFVVAEFGGPEAGNDSMLRAARANCEVLAATGTTEAAFICVPATAANMCKYRGQCGKKGTDL